MSSIFEFDDTFGLHEEVFGADDGAQADSMLDEVDQSLAQMDEEFGQDAALMRPDTTPGVQMGDEPFVSLVGEEADDFMRQAWYPDLVPDFAASLQLPVGAFPDAEADMLTRYFTRVPGVENWTQMDPAQKQAIIHRVIFASILGGEDWSSVGEVQEAWDEIVSAQGFWATVKEIPEGYVQSYWGFMKDFAQGVWNAVPLTKGQNLNQLALGIWAMHQLGSTVKATGGLPLVGKYLQKFAEKLGSSADPYDDIENQIDEAFARGYVVQNPQAGAYEGPSHTGEGAQFERPGEFDGSGAVETVQPASGLSLPEPQTILAFGYALTAALPLVRQAGWFHR